MRIFHGDCLEVLGEMGDESVDSVVCDPPYGISIMEKEWDKSQPAREIWRECFRVLKPGGYILAFSSGIRYHLLATAMESAGFETCNMMAWLYSNGLPRGAKLSREFDRGDGIPLPDDGFREYLKEAIKRSDLKITDLERMCGTVGMFRHYLGKSQPAFPTLEKWKIIKEALGLCSRYDALFEKIERLREEFRSVGEGREVSRHFRHLRKHFDRHVPRSDLARKWEGWEHGKMALRPCMEPIYFGQKPPLRPVRENVKVHGTGALNVEGCKHTGTDGRRRVPTNVMHDGSPAVVETLERGSRTAALSLCEFLPDTPSPFLYVPKPGKREREGNPHPTLKPLALMRHLVRLVTPPGGICLDPFMGSGTTGVACLEEGFDFIGIEKEGEYFRIALNRLGKNDSETHLYPEKEVA